jgi:hypothetical protein
MAVNLYSDNSTQITNFKQLRTEVRATHRHDCLPAERCRPCLNSRRIKDYTNGLFIIRSYYEFHWMVSAYRAIQKS